MGWNDGTEQEIFSPEELIQKFDLSRVQKSPARFDEQRLLWMNGMHIRALTPDTLLKLCEDHWYQKKQSQPTKIIKNRFWF